MNKKSNYLIIALIFIILAMGWQLYIRTQPTEKEQEDAKKEAEKIAEPEGIKIYENSSKTINGLFIGISSIRSPYVSCNFTFFNGAEANERMKVGQSFSFWGSDGRSYEIRLSRLNDTEYNKYYAIFEIKEGGQSEHLYKELQKPQNLNIESESYDSLSDTLKTADADTPSTIQTSRTGFRPRPDIR